MSFARVSRLRAILQTAQLTIHIQDLTRPLRTLTERSERVGRLFWYFDFVFRPLPQTQKGP